MAAIYLSPSTQDTNTYVTGGTEAEWMGRLADALVDYLDALGIAYARAAPDMTTSATIRASNEGEYGLHLALRSRAAPEGRYGPTRGVAVFHQPNSPKARRASGQIAAQLRALYPLPTQVTTQGTAAGALTRVHAPCVLLELGFHDDPDDAAWVSQNIAQIAHAIARALADYFELSGEELNL